MTRVRIGWRRAVGGAGLAVLLVILAVGFAKLIAIAIAAIGYPYDLDYGEGIVWQQMADIVAGHGYAPLRLFPAIVFHYPPVYHLTVAAVAALTGGDPLAVGRGVSLLSTLTAMALIGWLAVQASASDDRAARQIGALVAALAFAVSPTMLTWAPLMRVDLLATALTLAGLCATVRTLRAPDRLPLTEAALFALAVYTKQTAIVGPMAAFGALWVVRRAAAWRFAALCGGLGLFALAVLVATTHGQFLRHVVSYNVNRYDPTRWQLVSSVVASQATTIAIALAIVVKLRHDLKRHPARLLLALYFGLRVVTIPLALKSGASDNYFIDLFSAAAVYAGVAATQVTTTVLHGGRWPQPLLTGLLLLALPVQAARLGDTHEAMRDPAWRAANRSVVARLRATRRPVINDFMVLTRRAGRDVQFEPAIAAELAHAGMYDDRALAGLIRRQRFGVIVTDARLYDERYNPVVRAAIASAYPRTTQIGPLTMRSPR